jgi:2-polyprenyl-6-methoxyphenol hydroxylase-like FAD-dependent oxidoreductase
MHPGPITGRILIVFALPMPTVRFSVIIPSGCPVPANVLRSSVVHCDLLLDSLQPGAVQWDCKLESAELQGEQVLLRFASGQISLADIAVGSDGANSRLRELVTPIRPEYVGVSLVEGLIPEAKQMIPELWDLLGGSH